MKKEKTGGFRTLVKQLDLTCMLLPLAIVTALCILFMCNPEGSTRVIDAIRGFLGNQLGFFYIVLGFGLVIVTLYMGLSKYGSIRLGNLEKPEYSNFQWGTMIFTGVFAADIIYYSFIEWALYAGEKRISDLGSVQDWASTYPLFHWGPIPWAIYIVLAVSFGFMIHVRGRNRQKFSEACRPLLGSRVDGAVGKIIDLIAILALLAGTATTFSVTTPLLSAALCHVFGFTAGPWLTVAILVLIAILYTVATLKGHQGRLQIRHHLHLAVLRHAGDLSAVRRTDGLYHRDRRDRHREPVPELHRHGDLDGPPAYLRRRHDRFCAELDDLLLGVLDGLVRGDALFHR